MSNRDSMHGDATHTDTWEAAQRRPGSGGSGQAGNTADEAKAKGQQAANEARQKGEQAKQKASEAAGKARHRADEGMDSAADQMDKTADMIRQRGGEQGGTMGSAATTAADTLDSASTWLRDKDTDELMDEIEAYIRKNPTQSLLVAAGVGFVLSKVFR